MKKTKIDHYTDKEALDFHNSNKSGKIEIISSKPMITKRDLALAYSPGVAAPVRAISENPDAAYDYTSKGNLVAVISNGSAVLGMGNLGALASKPVMEGKAVLFKRFADINSIDIEIDSSDSDEIIKSIKNIAGSFGGINLEDIAAPDCFIIETKLKELKINLPNAPDPVGSYVAYKKIGNLLYISGQLPIGTDGKILKGKIGKNLTLQDGQKASKLCVINILAQAKKAMDGNLNKIKNCIKITGFVNSSDNFIDQPKVINPASEILAKVFENRGKHARAAVSVNSLPLDAAVEIEAIFEV